jgi:hypothetical protein
MGKFRKSARTIGSKGQVGVKLKHKAIAKGQRKSRKESYKQRAVGLSPSIKAQANTE